MRSCVSRNLSKYQIDIGWFNQEGKSDKTCPVHFSVFDRKYRNMIRAYVSR